MRGKSVLLIIGGGIAAYKSLELIRPLKERGVAVRAILTAGGAEFVTPLSVSALTGEKVFQDLFSLTDESEMGHIQLVALRRSGGGGARDRRSDGEARERPCQRSGVDRAARNRQAGADGARDECAHVEPSRRRSAI